MATEQARISNWRDELTPNIVDYLATVTPDAPYALYPNSPISYDQGYRTVTYEDFANAINGLAWWLEERLGACKTFDVVAYIGPNDVRYTALLLAAIKAGYVVCHDAQALRVRLTNLFRPFSPRRATASRHTMPSFRSWSAVQC